MMMQGEVYAIGVETAAARVGLIVGPLRAAFSAGRPCVLITRLSPEQFAKLLCRTRGAGDIAAAVNDGSLKLFTAIGDYAVNLFLHGAARYVNELDHFQIEEKSFVIIDQADDLFTPHDQMAVVDQARAYHEWCGRHRHTMLLLHLQTSRSRPILNGNQAAVQYFDGLARVTSETKGLRMAVDFWQSRRGYQIGTVFKLDSLLRSPLRNSGVIAAGGRHMGKIKRSDPVEAAERQRVWYLGPEDVALDEARHLIAWRHADSIDHILLLDGRRRRVNVLIGLDQGTHFRDLLGLVATLRSALGKEARLVVWEQGYRLREHLQKHLLLRAGIDSVLPRSAPLTSLPELLKAPPHLVAGIEGEQIFLACDLVDGVTGGSGARWLPATQFIQKAQWALRRSAPLSVPCALAEVPFDGIDGQALAEDAPSSTRSGDLSTIADDVRLFFLHGCRGTDAVQVVGRQVGVGNAHGLRRISLFTDDEAIAGRLEQLRQAADEAVLANITHGEPISNIVAMPAQTRSALKHGRTGTASIVALAMAFLMWQPMTECLAQESAARQVGSVITAPARGAVQAYEEGHYTEAARLGLVELQRDQSNHDLRLKVANSLAWTGQYRAAVEQYQALDRSPIADAATLGLAYVHLWHGHPELADPLFRRVLSKDTNNADASQGLAAAGRHLRPRTALRADWLDDSSDSKRSTVKLGHRWRDTSLMQVFELTAERGRESLDPGIASVNQRELAFTYEHLGLALAPNLEVVAQQAPSSKAFGSIGVKLAEGAVAMSIGRVNWGKLVFSPEALRDGLTANRAGMEVRTDTAIGSVDGSFAHFKVSDSNRVQDLNARYTPSWQPLPAGSGVRAFVGMYARKAQRSEARYWSPEDGYYTGYVGVVVDHSAADWDFSGELKRSLRLGGEGANGWSGGLGGKRWLNADWAIRADAYFLETRRDESVYRTRSLMVSLEYLW